MCLDNVQTAALVNLRERKSSEGFTMLINGPRIFGVRRENGERGNENSQFIVSWSDFFITEHSRNVH